MPSDARERMAEAIEEEMYEYADVFERALSTFTWNQGDVLVAKKEAVDNIIAHLWRMADRPEVVEVVDKALMEWSTHPDRLIDGYDHEMRTSVAITALLTALLGPRPTEQEATDV